MFRKIHVIKFRIVGMSFGWPLWVFLKLLSIFDTNKTWACGVFAAVFHALTLGDYILDKPIIITI